MTIVAILLAMWVAAPKANNVQRKAAIILVAGVVADLVIVGIVGLG